MRALVQPGTALLRPPCATGSTGVDTVQVSSLLLPSSPLAWMVGAVMLEASAAVLLALASLRTLLEQEASCLDPESFQARAALWHVEEASRCLTRALPPVPFSPGPRHPRL